MAEETKEVQEKKDGGKAIKTGLKMLLGIALTVLGLIVVWVWRDSLFILIKGCLGIFLVLAGVIAIAIAKE